MLIKIADLLELIGVPVRRLSSLLITLFFIAIISFSSAGAQGDDGEPTPAPDAGSNTIHVVQRGESLFTIAQQYGTTVDAISTANGITDARFLDIGQRLLIPNAQTETTGAVSEHIVQAGETLHTIALRYQTTPQTLSRLNNISHSGSVYVGQQITVNQGENGAIPIENAGLYVAQAGENQLSIAAKFGIPLDALREANNWTALSPVYTGQQIILPGRTDMAFIELPAPLTSFSFGPLPAIQGESMILQFSSDEILDYELNFMGRSVAVDEIEEGQYVAVLGVHALSEPDIYSLDVISNGETVFSVPFEVLEGEYGFESIDIPAEQQALLDSGTVSAELDLVSTVMSQFTSPAFVDGLMSLPAPGAVTSSFGTRRSYGGNETLTFHGGSDFGGAPGTVITAPAPGTVVLVDELQVRGNTVILDHGWGVYTGYWHQLEVYVSEGQFLKEGDQIGAIGSTGLSTGAHLHWEMWVSGVQVNPLQWVQSALIN